MSFVLLCLQLLIVVVVFGLLWWWLDRSAVREPFKSIGFLLIIVFAALILLWLVGLIPGGPVVVRP